MSRFFALALWSLAVFGGLAGLAAIVSAWEGFFSGQSTWDEITPALLLGSASAIVPACLAYAVSRIVNWKD